MPAPQSDRKPRRPRLSAEDRRASILDAATEVFSEVGYQRGKMSEVARRVGVSEPVVFQNFGSKAAVFAAVLDHAAERMSAGLRAWADRCPDIGTWLGELLAPEHLTRIHARGSLGVLFEDAMTLSGEPAILESARRANQALARTIADLLEHGRTDGSVRADLDPTAGAWWLISLLASQNFRRTVSPDPAHTDTALAALTMRLLAVDPPN
ncbi:hypothetical protein GCM10010441_25710 [Kitasatospora paracochleata]|uniref:AcrR family transcriptional regulator n=1 Tax=Kitasatospora paracochleata TaxID=58354 RepID=A0ABT1J1W1_9ACTN|nr:TetR/AcrR family transcriptional regulator [Kitasatospora paracochleata]MCP2311128.1 AcrR family transcriptional regulator [Kitasatospora paracochleata]